MSPILSIPTSPIEGQKTGTSGLRKKVAEIEKFPNYIENWIQSLVSALGNEQVSGSTFLLGGDGRYLNERAAVSAIEILAGNGVKKVIVGKNGLMSTPSVSNLIRSRKAYGGIIMTASHNAAGSHGDWGIKFNWSNGEPAPERITNKIYTETQKISVIRRADLGIKFSDLSTVGQREYMDDKDFVLDVVDPVADYVKMLGGIFDFEKISKFINSNPNCKIFFDAMHAVTGIYAKQIFETELHVPQSQLELLHCVPSPDFNGGHPDPNLVYAKDLVDKVNVEPTTLLGAASDGDGDRNMIVGSNWFVTPSDSLAIIADYAERAIPYFAQGQLSGVARSMPTSRAVDAVCRIKNIPCFETPTGWKYFGNLMDAHKAALCGEESFGTGANHIREKDGIWAVLAWLSILEFANRDSKQLKTIQAINEEHWDVYGRHIYCRCDYDEVPAEGANKMMDYIRAELNSLAGKVLQPGWTVETAIEYNYVDPVDGSEAKQQGLIISFTNGSRLVFRLSGTGSAGATVRMYMEYFTKEWRTEHVQLDKSPLMTIALQLSQIEKFTGRSHPSVIT